MGGGDNLRVVIFYALPTVHNVLHRDGGGGVAEYTCVCVCECELGAVSAASMSRRGSSDDGDFVSLAATSGFASIITCSFLSLSLCLALHSKNNNKKIQLIN